MAACSIRIHTIKTLTMAYPHFLFVCSLVLLSNVYVKGDGDINPIV